MNAVTSVNSGYGQLFLEWPVRTVNTLNRVALFGIVAELATLKRAAMSAKATFWAWSLRNLTSSQKLVLLCLSDNHNEDTNRCDPSVNYIADKTGLDRKTVMQSLSSLEGLGLISIDKRAGTSSSFSLKASTKNGTSTKFTPVPKTDATSTKNGQGPVPNLGYKSKTESKKNLKQLDFSKWPSTPSREAWDEYKKLRDKKRAPITQGVVNRLAKPVSELCGHGWTVDQIIQECVYRGWQGLESHWLLKNNPTTAQTDNSALYEKYAND